MLPSIINIEVKTVAITQKTKQQFIELRAEGMSYDKIAKKLKVSKTTLVAWSREYEVNIVSGSQYNQHTVSTGWAKILA